MDVSVESTSELSRRLTVRLPEERIQKEIATRLSSFAKQARIDGFRPGKVPQHIIQKRFGQQVRNEVLSELIESSFHDAIKSNQLRPAGFPQITPQTSEDSAGFGYVADFEVFPEFQLNPLEGLTVRKLVCEVTDSDVEAMVQKLREQRKTWSMVERPAQEGDKVTVAFEGRAEGKSFTDGRVEKFEVVIGSGQLIAGFEDRLTGATVGQHLEFTLPFPDNYGNADLAGKSGDFEVDVTQVEEPVLPDVDVEFIRSYGIDDGEQASFYADIRGNMEREMKRTLSAKLKEAVLDSLYQGNPITLPKALVEEELERIIEPLRKNAKRSNQTLDESTFKEGLKDVAQRRAALSLLLQELIKTNQIKLDRDRVRAAVEDFAASYESPQEVIDYYYSNPEQLQSVEGSVLEDQVIDFIAARAHCVEEQIGFQTLMQPANGSQSTTQTH